MHGSQHTENIFYICKKLRNVCLQTQQKQQSISTYYTATERSKYDDLYSATWTPIRPFHKPTQTFIYYYNTHSKQINTHTTHTKKNSIRNRNKIYKFKIIYPFSFLDNSNIVYAIDQYWALTQTQI